MYRSTACLEDMGQFAVIHDGIFDFVDERQNVLVEKEFENAAARRFRPCTPASHHDLSIFSPAYSELG